MTDQPTIANHRLHRDGPISGLVEAVDTGRDGDGQLYPVVLVRHGDGSTRTVHFERVDHIAKLAQAAPKIGDRVSVHLGGDLSVSPGPDYYGEIGTRQPAADWSTWANRAYRRHPDNPRQIEMEATHPTVEAPAGRYRRRVRMADGREGFTYDQPPVVDHDAEVVPSRDGSGFEVKR